MTKEDGSATISRGFNDPDAATVFGNIMRFSKRPAFFYFARCAFRRLGSSSFYSPNRTHHPEDKLRMTGVDFWDPVREIVMFNPTGVKGQHKLNYK
jgi:hypothetical protein